MSKLHNSKSGSKFDEGKIDFIGKIKIFVGISILLFILAIGDIMFKGLNYGIDFAGGNEVQIRFKDHIKTEDIRSFLKTVGIEAATIQAFGGSNDFSVRFESMKAPTEKVTNELNAKKMTELSAGLKTTFEKQGVEVLSQSTVGPQIGSQLKRNSILAMFYSLLVILIYVGLRFDYNFAPGAVLCLFHDSVLTMGVLVFLGKEINVQIVAAILTLIGYSLNDTIVVFDRIRENIHVFRDSTLPQIINRSINDTLGRTIITSLTVFLASIALYVFAAGEISDFGFTMALGVVFGTYSSIYVAAPLIIAFDKVKHMGSLKSAA